MKQTRTLVTITLIAAVAFMAAPTMMTKMVYAVDIHHTPISPDINAYINEKNTNGHDTNAPYTNDYGDAVNYYSNGHPSEPNHQR